MNDHIEVCPWCEGNGVVDKGGCKPVSFTLYREAIEALVRLQADLTEPDSLSAAVIARYDGLKGLYAKDPT